MISVKLETITPQFAAEVLARQEKRTRPKRKRWIERLAKDIRAGQWQENAETIKFSGHNGDSKLLDGQHRFEAIVMAGVPVKTWVAYGVPDAAFSTIDRGHTRSLGDVLSARGELNYTKLAAAIRWIGTLYGRNPLRDRVTIEPWEAERILQKYPGLRDSVSYATNAAASYLISQSLVGALHYLFGRKDKELAQLFFDRIGDGEGLLKSQPMWRLRDRLIKLKSSQAKLAQEVIAAYVIKAWNATRENRRLDVIKFIEGEEMPAIV